MAEASISRALRSGAADGEHAAAVMVSSAVHTSAGRVIFSHFVEALAATIVSGSAQAKGLVVVAMSTSPDTYLSKLSKLSADDRVSRFQVLDCFSDPLGWERQISPTRETDAIDIRDLTSLFSRVRDAGRALAGDQQKGRFSVAIDSLSLLMRHHSLAAVSRFICQLRALDGVSCILWFTHSGLHERRVLDSLAYNTTAAVFVEPQLDFLEERATGRLRIQQKRRNGRILEKVDEFKVDVRSLKFFPVELAARVDTAANMHKVQFRLDLSDKEVEDRSKVKLPFEHQGDGQEVRIYDGRELKTTTPADSKPSNSSQTSSVHYLRDSDDEFPDSDEDPDDDLDI